MPSADFRHLITPPFGCVSRCFHLRSCRTSSGKLLNFHAYTRLIDVDPFRSGFGLWSFRPPRPESPPHIRFLFVGSAVCRDFLRIRPRDRHPCPLANRSPWRADRGLTPPSSITCRAHLKKPGWFPA